MIKKFKDFMVECNVNEFYDENSIADNDINKISSRIKEYDTSDAISLDTLKNIGSYVFDKKETANGVNLYKCIENTDNCTREAINAFFSEFCSQWNSPRLDKIDNISINPGSDIYSISFEPTSFNGFNILLSYEEGTQVYVFEKNAISEFECVKYEFDSNITENIDDGKVNESDESIYNDVESYKKSLPISCRRYASNIIFVKKELEDMCEKPLKIHWSDLGNSISFWTFDENGGGLITNIFGIFVEPKKLLNVFDVFKRGYNLAKGKIPVF